MDNFPNEPYIRGCQHRLGARRKDYGNAYNAVFAVLLKLTFTLLPDGNMTSSSQYFKGKTNVPGGHEFRYHADPDAKLVFTETSKPHGR